MTCELLDKQVVYRFLSGPTPCENLMIEGYACTHYGEKYTHSNPLNWKKDEKYLSPQDILNHPNFKKTPKCDDCVAKKFFTDYVKDTKKIMLNFFLGNECNLACRMCNPAQSNNLVKEYEKFEKMNLVDEVIEVTDGYYVKDSNPGMDLPDHVFDWILNNTDKIGGLSITGGEPLINKKFYEIVSALKKTGDIENINLRLFTNGSVFNKKTLDILNSFNKTFVNISIDGTDEVYDFIRYGASFKKFNKNIDYLYNNIKNAGSIHFNMTINVINLFNIKYVYDWHLKYKKTKIKTKLHFIPVASRKRGISLNNLDKKILDLAAKDANNPFITEMFNNIIKCSPDRKKILKELELFDMIRGQNYKDVIDEKMLNFLNDEE